MQAMNCRLRRSCARALIGATHASTLERTFFEHRLRIFIFLSLLLLLIPLFMYHITYASFIVGLLKCRLRL